MSLSPHELIQIATVLQAQAIPLLTPYCKDSPKLVAAVIGALDDLPRILEEAFLEVDTIHELERASADTRRRLMNMYFGSHRYVA